MLYKLFKLFCLSSFNFLWLFSAQATITFTSIAITESGVATRDFSTAPTSVTNKEAIEISCNSSTAIYGYTCTSGFSTDQITLTLNMSGTGTNQYLKVFHQSASGDINDITTSTTLFGGQVPTPGDGTEEIKATIYELLSNSGNVNLTSTTSIDTITIYFKLTNDTGDTDTTTGDVFSMKFKVDNVGPTDSSTAISGLIVEAADQTILIGSFTLPTTTDNFQFYVIETLSGTCEATDWTTSNFGSAAASSAATLFAVVNTQPTETISISGLDNTKDYCLAYAKSDDASNIDTTNSLASGTITVNDGDLDDGTDAITIGTTTLTEGTQFLEDATSATNTATNITTAINANLTTVTATSSGAVITLKAVTGGTGGNTIVLAETDNATDNFTLSGGTLSGGGDSFEYINIYTTVLQPGEVIGLLDKNLSCISATTGSGGGGVAKLLEWLGWLVLMILGSTLFPRFHKGPSLA